MHALCTNFSNIMLFHSRRIWQPYVHAGRCKQGCKSVPTPLKRRKRKVSTSEESFQPTTIQSYKIKRGPIQITDKKGELKGNQSIKQYFLKKRDSGTKFGYLPINMRLLPHRNTLMRSAHMLIVTQFLLLSSSVLCDY